MIPLLMLSKLADLRDYIESNQSYIVNYEQRNSSGLPYTSTIAESSVNNLINVRQKQDKKLQWTREGAHQVLQIRTSRYSNTWQEDWQHAQDGMYRKAA